MLLKLSKKKHLIPIEQKSSSTCFFLKVNFNMSPLLQTTYYFFFNYKHIYINKVQCMCVRLFFNLIES